VRVAVRCVGLVTAAVAVALGASLVTPAQAATPDGTPVDMPARLEPGSWTKPLYPERAVPAYASPTVARARARSGSGAAELTFNVPTPVGSTMLMGDWNGDGASTPAVFADGHWVLYGSVIGQAPPAVAAFDFGGPGDKPVVGDWNGDGRTDIGVVTGNVWSLRDSASAGAAWKVVAYGLATDLPVTGDWDGDRRDGIGVVRGGAWFLRNVNAADAKQAARTAGSFKFGLGTDHPVTGDWDGDGDDTVGVVRGATWFLRNTNAAGTSDVRRTVNRPPDSAPVVWRTLGGPAGAACPTAMAVVGRRPPAAPLVKPSLVLDKGREVLPQTDGLGYELRIALLNAERFLTGTDYESRWAKRRSQRFTDVLERFATPEYNVRLPAMAALTVAISTRTGAHSDPNVGRTRDESIAYADWLVRSLACTHLALTPGGWGHAWQSPHWAMLAGQAGWMLWDQLTPQTREYVAQMVVDEADYTLTRATEYWADASGTVVSPGDTKAEENAWNAALLELAVNMLPTHPRAPRWREKAVDLAVASYATLTDRNRGDLVNGVPLSTRLQGSNAYADHTVENHLRIHPDYMANIQHLWWAADLARLAGRPTPEAIFFNAPQTYAAFSTLPFTEGATGPIGGPYAAPGGTIYQPTAAYPAEIYFPQGSTWGTVRRAPFISLDSHAMAYGLDALAPLKAEDALRAHLVGQLKMQGRSGVDGRTYSTDRALAETEDTYLGREEYAAQQLATAWLARYLARNGPRTRIDRSTYAIPAVKGSPAPRDSQVPQLRRQGRPPQPLSP
jgi:hypothetical protein